MNRQGTPKPNDATAAADSLAKEARAAAARAEPVLRRSEERHQESLKHMSRAADRTIKKAEKLRATAATRRARARGKDPSAALRRFEDDLPSLEGDSEGVLHYVDLVEKAGIDAYKIFSEVTLPRLHFAKGYRDYWLREFARPETDRFVRDCFWWAFATKNRARGGERHATLAIEQVLFERVSQAYFRIFSRMVETGMERKDILYAQFQQLVPHLVLDLFAEAYPGSSAQVGDALFKSQVHALVYRLLTGAQSAARREGGVAYGPDETRHDGVRGGFGSARPRAGSRAHADAGPNPAQLSSKLQHLLKVDRSRGFVTHKDGGASTPGRAGDAAATSDAARTLLEMGGTKAVVDTGPPESWPASGAEPRARTKTTLLYSPLVLEQLMVRPGALAQSHRHALRLGFTQGVEDKGEPPIATVAFSWDGASRAVVPNPAPGDVKVPPCGTRAPPATPRDRTSPLSPTGSLLKSAAAQAKEGAASALMSTLASVVGQREVDDEASSAASSASTESAVNRRSILREPDRDKYRNVPRDIGFTPLVGEYPTGRGAFEHHPLSPAKTGILPQGFSPSRSPSPASTRRRRRRHSGSQASPTPSAAKLELPWDSPRRLAASSPTSALALGHSGSAPTLGKSESAPTFRSAKGPLSPKSVAPAAEAQSPRASPKQRTMYDITVDSDKHRHEILKHYRHSKRAARNEITQVRTMAKKAGDLIERTKLELLKPAGDPIDVSDLSNHLTATRTFFEKEASDKKMGAARLRKEIDESHGGGQSLMDPNPSVQDVLGDLPGIEKASQAAVLKTTKELVDEQKAKETGSPAAFEAIPQPTTHFQALHKRKKKASAIDRARQSSGGRPEEDDSSSAGNEDALSAFLATMPNPEGVTKRANRLRRVADRWKAEPLNYQARRKYVPVSDVEVSLAQLMAMDPSKK